MTLCVVTKAHCVCQPDEGVFCPDYKPDAYVQYLMDAITELRAASSNGPDDAATILRGVINHWVEFGPEGMDECIHHAATRHGPDGEAMEAPTGAVMSQSSQSTPSGADDQVRVLRVQVNPGYGEPALILGEHQKDQLWAYCEDWSGRLYIELGTMPRAAFDALPEFEGF